MPLQGSPVTARSAIDIVRDAEGSFRVGYDAGGSLGFQAQQFTNGATSGPLFLMERGRADGAPPQSGDTLARLYGRGLIRGGTVPSFNGGASARVVATENFSPTAAGAEWQIWATPAGTLNQVLGLRIRPSVVADDTWMMLYDVTAAAAVRVSRGAADSGGAGFRVLRIPN